MKKRSDEYYMSRCLELARKGAGWVSPNPMVGSVLVKDGRIIAEGYHSKYGGRHAERIVLKKAGKRARGGTLYVNLEPCAHHGRTPPCTDAICEAGVRSVVAAIRDPNPWVVGGGLRKLRQAGIKVRVGTLKKEAQLLNEKFITFVTSGLPFVGVKVAQTLDGKVADAWGMSKWITGEAARRYGHLLRSEYDAILVGANTIVRDNPELTVRLTRGRNPVRVVVDGRLSAPVGARVFSTRSAKTIILTSTRALKGKSRKVRQLTARGVEVIPVSNSYALQPDRILQILSRFNISSILVEGGSETIAKFLNAKVVHKIHCFIAPKAFGGGISAWRPKAPVRIAKSILINNPRIIPLGGDVLVEGHLQST